MRHPARVGSLVSAFLVGLSTVATGGAAAGPTRPAAGIRSPAAGTEAPLGGDLTFAIAPVSGATAYECAISQENARWHEVVGAASTDCSADHAVVSKKFKGGRATFQVRAKVGSAEPDNDFETACS